MLCFLNGGCMVAVWWMYGGCMVAVWWLYGGCMVAARSSVYDDFQLQRQRSLIQIDLPTKFSSGFTV